MMKLGIPIWEGKVSPVFDTATTLMVLEMEERRERSRSKNLLQDQDFGRRCFRIQGLGVEVLICGAISRQLYDVLTAAGIEVIPWISGQAEHVLKAYMDGTLLTPQFMMPGCDAEKWLDKGGSGSSCVVGKRRNP
jgi:predicted Fe-Mo cluster-binding NifX family protein